MSDMSLEKAYGVMQAHCGIEVGDKVKVLRVPNKADRRLWPNNSDYGYFAAPAGKRTKISEVHLDDEIGLRVLCNGAVFPWWCLELVEKTKPKLPPIMIAARAVEFFDDAIGLGGGVIVSKETLCAILERLEN